jgi:ubiquitin C-terminal hydrolase
LAGDSGKLSPQKSLSQGTGAPPKTLPQLSRIVRPSLLPTTDTVQTKVRASQSILPSGLHNFGATCYANSAMQLLNAIRPFRRTIMNSTSKHPLVLGFQELFNGINSSDWTSREESKGKLEKLWNGKILPNVISLQSSSLRIQEDVAPFMLGCFDALDGDGKGRKGAEEQATKCFQHEKFTKIQEKANRNVHRTALELEFFFPLPLATQPEKKEISGEFMSAFRDFGAEEKLTGSRQWENPSGEKVDAIAYRRIKDPPPVLLVQLMRFSSNHGDELQKNCRPMSIPLEFNFPQEIMEHPKPVKYKLIGGLYHSGTLHSGHYIAYITTKDGFLEFNDDQVRQLSTSEGLNALRVGAYVVAYERQN